MSMPDRDKRPDLGGVFDEHVKREFQDQDLEGAMQTMNDDPYVHCVPTLTGGIGYNAVRDFYQNRFIGHWPADTTISPVARTVGEDRVVDEMVISFTHDRVMDYILPGVAPTGRHVDIASVVVMGFEDGKIAHEHIYWDQASVLVQVGLLDPEGLPVAGAEQARKLLSLSDS
jgi:carboxymethylenebutenolidase